MTGERSLTDAEITVIMPTFNRREFLPHALDCILRQTYRRWRMFVINDGGVDVADLVRAAGDARIEYFDRPHAGKAAQLNFALRHTDTRYVAYMDDDDEVFPEHLEKLHAAAERLGSDFVYSDTWQTVLGADGQLVSRTVENTDDVTFDGMRLFNRINHKQILHTRELAERVGEYDESMRILIDFDYIKRLLRLARNPFHLREVTGDHFLRTTSSAAIGGSAITGLWQRDPIAAGRSLLSFFEKDPESLGMLYRMIGERDSKIGFLQSRLDDRLSVRWRRWRHRNDHVEAVPCDALPPEVRWVDRTPTGGLSDFFSLADEHDPTIAAVNRIAAGSAEPGDAERIRLPMSSPLSSPSTAWSITPVDGGARYSRAPGTPMRWIVLCSREPMPPDFAVSFVYVPHAVFKEQLQLDFAMNSLGERTRFMVRNNERLVFSRVRGGKFLPDDRVLRFCFELDSPVSMRVESVGGVTSLSVDGRVMMSMRAETPPTGGYLALVFYQESESGAIDLELRDFRLEVPSCGSES